MNHEHLPDLAPEWPVAPTPAPDPALAALEAAWRMGALVETEPTA